MSVEQIKERILSDAREEANSIVAEAETKAANLRAEAQVRAETLELETKAEMEERRKSILEKREAAARLDGAKLLLGEKEEAELVLMDLMEQWEAAQEGI